MLLVLGDSDGERNALDVVGSSQFRKIPEDFALVLRTLVLLNGLSHRLAPSRRLIQAELLKHLAAGAAALDLDGAGEYGGARGHNERGEGAWVNPR